MNENDEKENSLNNNEFNEVERKEKSVNKLEDIEDIDKSSCEVIKGFKNEPEEIKIERVKDNKTYDRSIKIILIGKCKVGKTSIINNLTNKKFNEKYEPSLSLEYTNYTIKINDYIIRMQIWDSSGQEKYEPGSIILNYYKTAEVAIFIYAIDDLESFENINEYIKDLIYDNKEQNDIKKVLIGNKLDLSNERKIEYKTTKNFAKKHKFDLFSEITCKNDNSKSIINIFNLIGKIYYEEHSRLSFSSSMRYSASASIIEIKEQNVDGDVDEKCCVCCNIF